MRIKYSNDKISTFRPAWQSERLKYGFYIIETKRFSVVQTLVRAPLLKVSGKNQKTTFNVMSRLKL